MSFKIAKKTGCFKNKLIRSSEPSVRLSAKNDVFIGLGYNLKIFIQWEIDFW